MPKWHKMKLHSECGFGVQTSLFHSNSSFKRPSLEFIFKAVQLARTIWSKIKQLHKKGWTSTVKYSEAGQYSWFCQEILQCHCTDKIH